MSCLPARQQIAAPLEDRVGGGRQVRVDPLQTKLADVAGRARVLGHEHGRRCPRIAGQPLDHLLDDIAGMLEISRGCQDFR